ncbi:hypothetical protein FKM82_006056 [Ascaphus truei]
MCILKWESLSEHEPFLFRVFGLNGAAERKCLCMEALSYCEADDVIFAVWWLQYRPLANSACATKQLPSARSRLFPAPYYAYSILPLTTDS